MGPRRLLIAEAALLGDLVMATPLMAAAMREGWEVHAAIRASAHGLLDGLLPPERIHLLPPHPLKGRKCLRGVDPDLTLVTHRAHSTLLSVAGGRGPCWGYLGMGRGLLLRGGVRFNPMEHRVSNHLRLAKAAGLDPAPEEPLRLAATPGPCPEMPEGALILNPNASWPEKAWSVSRWEEFASAASEALGTCPVVVGGVGDRERTHRVASACGGLDLGGKTDLPTLKRVLAKGRVMVTHDSGPSHIAVALGTPVVGIFGATSPELVGPWPCASARVLAPPRAVAPPSSGKGRRRWIDDLPWEPALDLAKAAWA